MKAKQSWFKRSEVVATVSAFAIGLLIHMFALTNVLHNNDDINVQPQGVGTTLPSGRWFLYIINNFGENNSGNYNLPWVNGFLFILLLAVAVGVVVSTFKIKCITASVLMGAAFVSFPSVTATLFFRFTAPAYGLAILLSVLAVWTLEKWKYVPLSVLFIALSMGIYQAYFPLTVSLILLLLIQYALQKGTRFIAVIKRGFFYLGTLIAGLVLYFLVLNAMLKAEQVELLDYQGISSINSISLLGMPGLALRAWKEFLLLPFRDYCDLATSPILRCAYLLLGIVSIVIGCLLLCQNKKGFWETCAIVLLCFIFPVGVNLIVLMGATFIYTLMVFPFVTILFVPFILLDTLSTDKKTFGKIRHIGYILVGSIVSVIILLNAYFANINYTAMYYANRQVENFYNSVATQIHMAEDYDLTKKWAFIGYANNVYFNEPAWGGDHYYGVNPPAANLINQYSGKDWIYSYLGHQPPLANQAEKNSLAQMQEVQDMPCWPNYGSIKVIDSYVVIKLSN